MHSIKRFIPASFVVLWATGFIGARYAMPWAEPFTFLAARFVLAAILLAVLTTVLGSRKASRAEACHAAVAGLLMHGVYLGAVFWAIHRGMPAGFSALIVGLQPLITAVLAGKFLGEAILPRHWIGLAVGLVGVVIVLWPKLGAVGGGVTAATLTASLVSVLAMSAGTVWQKRFASGGDLVTATMWQYVGGAALMVLASLAFETRTVTINGELIFALAWLVLVLSIGAIFLLMVMIRDGEMSKVASLFYLVPAVTAVIAWALFGEHLNLLQIVGMAIATLGVGLATARPASPGRSQPMRARASR
ncbi:MAG: DMT family transporter [Mesorhizobium sp.]|uniref:DMT family transporter n=2 Tax=Mesorhizobium TaxID=68287 RepID=UPI000F74DCD1|nr:MULTISPECIES: DMT family transporter [unclassified Mesorhizobium]RVD67863.1 DMT family transporter [Mesorhizobium sp. M4A.F.Ca.ET.029.04.2.1]AZO50800.1 DMT family transporter [Mesorhizobium sp. M4B.F.Ca.ET.058.02.1.1]RVC82293.1 DMT family transporter [Mesorhizobium sp. M4A.F.Ca.ET.022.05.2.1]RWC22767.1 MAG: DMT family transporter [Mesorhizobium sp.]RWC55432.1 MAG: DMT family transporter [Mesorhizobium sp.]